MTDGLVYFLPEWQTSRPESLEYLLRENSRRFKSYMRRWKSWRSIFPPYSVRASVSMRRFMLPSEVVSSCLMENTCVDGKYFANSSGDDVRALEGRSADGESETSGTSKGGRSSPRSSVDEVVDA